MQKKTGVLISFFVALFVFALLSISVLSFAYAEDAEESSVGSVVAVEVETESALEAEPSETEAIPGETETTSGEPEVEESISDPNPESHTAEASEPEAEVYESEPEAESDEPDSNLEAEAEAEDEDGETEATEPAEDKPTLLCIGDSYIQGWAPEGMRTSWGRLVGDILGAETTVYGQGGVGFAHVGQSGTNFPGFIDSVREWYGDKEPDMIILAGGINDAMYGSSSRGFANGAKSAVSKLLSYYPNAKIYVLSTCGPMA